MHFILTIDNRDFFGEHSVQWSNLTTQDLLPPMVGRILRFFLGDGIIEKFPQWSKGVIL